MGTNYYLHVNVCKHCNRAEEVLHVGKSSMGWQFHFHGIKKYYEDDGRKEVLSFDDWKDLIKDSGNVLYDEYGSIQDKAEFLEFVLNKQLDSKNINHVDYCRGREHQSYLDTLWKDSKGFGFSSGEFS